MRTHVEFRSPSFPPYEGEEDEVNPGLWGRRLAEYLAERLRGEGFLPEAIDHEDWGWVVFLCNPEFPLWVGCGHQDGDEDEFLCFVQPDRPFVRRVFKRIDTRDVVERVVAALDRILAAEPSIRGVRWWPEDERQRM